MTTDNQPTMEESCRSITNIMRERLGPAYDAEILAAIGKIMSRIDSNKPIVKAAIRNAAFDLYSETASNPNLKSGAIYLAAMHELEAAE